MGFFFFQILFVFVFVFVFGFVFGFIFSPPSYSLFLISSFLSPQFGDNYGGDDDDDDEDDEDMPPLE